MQFFDYNLYYFFNSKVEGDNEDSLFDLNDFDNLDFKVGETYKLKVCDLSVSDYEDQPTYHDYQKYIQGKDKITITINWIELQDFDSGGKEFNVGFSF